MIAKFVKIFVCKWVGSVRQWAMSCFEINDGRSCSVEIVATANNLFGLRELGRSINYTYEGKGPRSSLLMVIKKRYSEDYKTSKKVRTIGNLNNGY